MTTRDVTLRAPMRAATAKPGTRWAYSLDGRTGARSNAESVGQIPLREVGA